MRRVIAHPLSMIGSDGLPHDQHPHPRLWGAFPRVLARYWREQQLFSLETAIYKMTGLSARNFRLDQRGQLQVGWHADVVVLDPARVRDVATYENPIALSEGIEKVFVNGALAYSADAGDTGDVRVQALGQFVGLIGGLRHGGGVLGGVHFVCSSRGACSQANAADRALPGRWRCPLEGERRSRFGGGFILDSR